MAGPLKIIRSTTNRHIYGTSSGTILGKSSLGKVILKSLPYTNVTSNVHCITYNISEFELISYNNNVMNE